MGSHIMSIKIIKNPKSIQTQGILLLDKSIEKYEALEQSKELIKLLNNLFQRKGNYLTNSKLGDEIYYFNKNLEDAIKILEKLK